MSTSHLAKGNRTPKSGSRTAKSVFLSAPLSADVSTIRKVLKEQGVRTVTSDELVNLGLTFREVLTEAIGKADRMIALVPEPGHNGNVLFELGVGIGLGKNVLLIASQDVKPSADLMGIPYLRARLNDEDALRFGLRHFLQAPHHGKTSRKAVAETRPLEGLAGRLRAEYSGNPSGMVEEELVRIVSTAFLESGASVANSEVIRGNGPPESRIDLGVWTKDFLPWADKPLVVEVKSQLGSQSAAKNTCDQLEKIATGVASPWAVLVYGSATPAAEAEIKRHRVLAISLDQLLQRMRHDSLGKVMYELRNQAVHSVPSHG